MAATTKPASAKESATRNISSRLRVMPCWKISTGQPPAGGTAPCSELAFGTVTSTGIIRFAFVATGRGLKRVTFLLVASRGNGGACQEAVTGQQRIDLVGSDAGRVYLDGLLRGVGGGQHELQRVDRGFGREAEGEHDVGRIHAESLCELQV